MPFTDDGAYRLHCPECESEDWSEQMGRKKTLWLKCRECGQDVFINYQ